MATRLTKYSNKERKNGGHVMCFMSLNDTPDRFVNEPDNMVQQQMPSIILNSYGCFSFFSFLSPILVFVNQKKQQPADFKLFPLRLIYF